jgi:hypothetical protein
MGYVVLEGKSISENVGLGGGCDGEYDRGGV